MLLQNPTLDINNWFIICSGQVAAIQAATKAAVRCTKRCNKQRKTSWPAVDSLWSLVRNGDAAMPQVANHQVMVQPHTIHGGKES